MAYCSLLILYSNHSDSYFSDNPLIRNMYLRKNFEAFCNPVFRMTKFYDETDALKAMLAQAIFNGDDEICTVINMKKLKVKKENIYPEIFLKYPALQHKDIAAIEAEVRKEARAFAASVIRGEREIESDWGKYCARLAEIGIEKAIVAHQAAYNRYATK